MLRVVLPGDPDRAALVARLLHRDVVTSPVVHERARALVERVRREGDAALVAITREIEHRELASVEIPRATWHALADETAPDVRAALERAHARIRRFHDAEARTFAHASFTVDEGGARMGLRVTPLARVGVYAPGGTALYPSSVLMGVVPARAAGVAEVFLVTPGPSREVLYAAKIAGVDRVFAVGGAQAVAALAYGTESVPRVDKIVGPGNAYVAAAKRIVYGDVDIDGVAGPSEILVVADAGADPAWLAADLLSQAEHDTEAWAVLVTTSDEIAGAVAAEVEAQLATLPRRTIAEASIRAHGAAVVVGSLDEALAFANDFAPEHLELAVADAHAALQHIRTAGAIFVGAHTPEAAGDYYAGPNHVLPTGGAARFGGPLGVHDFLKRTSTLAYDEATLRAHAGDITRLADVEGLHAHARAVEMRVGRGAK